MTSREQARRRSDGYARLAAVDPIDQLPQVHPMRGFRMFVASDPDDEEVSFASQAAYVQAAKADGLDIRFCRGKECEANEIDIAKE